MVMQFSPELKEWIPAIGGLIAAAFLGGLALYTRYSARPRKKDSNAD